MSKDNSLVRKTRAVFIELYSRVVKLVEDKKNGDVYWNGENNLYPNEVELVVNSSPTASSASKIMAKYIHGKGLTDETKDILVNERKNYKVSNINELAAADVAEQGGVWFHRGFGIDVNEATQQVKIVPRTLDILEYSKCRKGKEDDEKNDSKIYYRDYSEQKTMLSQSKTKEEWFYPFNDNQDVIIAQIKADYATAKGEDTDDISVMLPYYRGQVYYWNTTPRYKYALAPIDPAYNDADSESRIQTWTNGEIRLGFLGKTSVITQGLDEETAKDIDQKVAAWLGENGSKGVFRLDLANTVEDISKVLNIQQVKAQIDPKLFSDLKKEIRSTILGMYCSIPEILVLSSSGTVFGTSGEAYEQAKIFYNEQTEQLRVRLSEVITHLGFPCEIEPLVKTEVAEVDENKNLTAQATLRGTSSGVTSIIELVKAVSQGYTEKVGAVKILTQLYGISEEDANIIIGDPVETVPETQTTEAL